MKDLQLLVNELQSTNSINDKKEILAKYPQCKELLMYVYNQYYQYNITSKNLQKRKDLNDNILCNTTIINVLDSLRERKVTGHSAIAMVNNFIENNKQYEELIYNIIDKNLKVRIDTSSINKVYPDLIPTFKVPLAYYYSDHRHRVDFNKDNWLVSRKLNGLRCIIRKENGTATLYSRTGKEFKTLSVLKGQIEALTKDNFVLDGEVCLIKNGLEDFQGILREYSRKNHTIKNPKYIIFDNLTLGEFDTRKSTAILSDRLKRSDDIKPELNNKYIEILEHEIVRDESHLLKLLDSGEKLGWEGRIIRKDTVYEAKRTNNLLKVKIFKDAEYVVQGIETGIIRAINEDTGLEEELLTMTRVNVEHKGNIVGVGSGWKLRERKKYFNNPQSIIGKTINVQYKEETINEKGEHSLQFPTIQFVYEDGRDA